MLSIYVVLKKTAITSQTKTHSNSNFSKSKNGKKNMEIWIKNKKTSKTAQTKQNKTRIRTFGRWRKKTITAHCVMCQKGRKLTSWKN